MLILILLIVVDHHRLGLLYHRLLGGDEEVVLVELSAGVNVATLLTGVDGSGGVPGGGASPSSDHADAISAKPVPACPPPGVHVTGLDFPRHGQSSIAHCLCSGVLKVGDSYSLGLAGIQPFNS